MADPTIQVRRRFPRFGLPLTRLKSSFAVLTLSSPKLPRSSICPVTAYNFPAAERSNELFHTTQGRISIGRVLVSSGAIAMCMIGSMPSFRFSLSPGLTLVAFLGVLCAAYEAADLILEGDVGFLDRRSPLPKFFRLCSP